MISDIVHHAAPILFGVAGLLGTVGKWTQACWPLVLAGSVIWLVVSIG